MRNKNQVSRMMATTLEVKLSVVLLLTAAAATIVFQFAWAQSPLDNTSRINIFPPDSDPYGLTFGNWTTKWSQWAYSIPTENNPLIDDTGENCSQAQNQTGPVWFLAGTAPGSVERTCTISA